MPRLATQKISDYQEKFLFDKSMETGESRASIVRKALFNAAYEYNCSKGINPFEEKES